MSDALSSEDALSMTHQTPAPSKPYIPQGNPQVLSDIGNFAGGGMHGVLKGRGVEMPAWMDKPAQVLNSQVAQDALSVLPLGTIAARSDITKDLLKSLLAKGMSRQQIADQLGAGIRTIDRNIDNYGLGPRAKPIVRSPTPQADLQDLRSKSYGETPSKTAEKVLPDGTRVITRGTEAPARVAPAKHPAKPAFMQGAPEEPINLTDLAEYLKIFSYKE